MNIKGRKHENIKLLFPGLLIFSSHLYIVQPRIIFSNVRTVRVNIMLNTNAHIQ